MSQQLHRSRLIAASALAVSLTAGFFVPPPAAEAAQRVEVSGLDTVLGAASFEIVRFSGVEALSRPYLFELELVSSDWTVDPAAMLGTRVAFRVTAPGRDARLFNGVISRFVAGDADGNVRDYRAEVVPGLWLMTLTRDLRWHQERTAPEIVTSVLRDFGVARFEFRLEDDYPLRECTAQYRETDLNFLSRLMQEEGIFYYFEHGDNGETMVITDANRQEPDTELTFDEEVSSWVRSVAAQSSRFTHQDFAFEQPGLDLTTTALAEFGSDARLEVYDYPGLYQERANGDRLARIRAQVFDAASDLRNGTGVLPDLFPGTTFTIAGHFDPEENGSYYVTQVRHELELNGRSDRYDYESRFTAIPASLPFRPQRTTPRPRIAGPQTGIVVGPAGEEVYSDEYGRVKVQFHWDRLGESDENSSCWMRVAQDWSDVRVPALGFPEIGDEVIVGFLEGDIDQPIILGRVYNGGDHLPPPPSPNVLIGPAPGGSP